MAKMNSDELLFLGRELGFLRYENNGDFGK